ncbi:MAG: Glycosyl transferase group 1 [Nitrospira sp.]|nr:MAG: Glycosyl transferase group 1 [Nitrospira sp.]
MKVVHVSTEDISGGAARAAYRLHTGLRMMGHDSSMLVVNRRSKDPHVTAFDASMDWASRIRRKIRREQVRRDFARYAASRPAGIEIFSDDRSEFGSDVAKHLPHCDVLNLHWVARYVDYEGFFSTVPERTPVVWRIADMNPITGGCHVDEGCGRFLSGCGACPQLGSVQTDDLSSQVWRRKRKTFDAVDARRLHLVALNRWMQGNLAGHPFLRKFPVTIIPNGVDTDMFAPRDRRFAREMLGLPQNATILLFVAVMTEMPYKGFTMLAQALAGLSGVENLRVVSVGIGKPELGTPIPHVHLGYVTDDRVLVLAYNAADVFVVPALYDNSPNTILEAMACGIPVAAFATGGIPDMVREGLTGSLSPRYDVEALRAAIKDLLVRPDKRREMGARSREVALQDYTLPLQTSRYTDLYRSLL